MPGLFRQPAQTTGPIDQKGGWIVQLHLQYSQTKLHLLRFSLVRKKRSSPCQCTAPTIERQLFLVFKQAAASNHDLAGVSHDHLRVG
jgi:hypothetical protein